MADTVNSQVTDAITQTAAATVGQAASVALGMFFQAEAQAFADGIDVWGTATVCGNAGGIACP